jgi:predicted nucleic acid-binding protein
VVIVDTSVWINHFKSSDLDLVVLLDNNKVLMHDFVIGEIACGSLKARAQKLELLNDLPKPMVADISEVLFFIEKNKLMSKGVGFVDTHLLASASISKCKVWTYDKRLQLAAEQLKLSYQPLKH